MRNLLDTSKCKYFSPTFDNRECSYYKYSEGDGFEQRDWECGFCTRPEQKRCIADITRPIPLSHSSVEAFTSCHYYYYLTRIIGVSVKNEFLGNALKAGKLWDTIKQVHLGESISIKKVIEDYQIDPMTVAKVRGLYHAYKELGIEVDEGGELQAKVDLKLNVKLGKNDFMPTVNIGKEAINLWAIRETQKEQDEHYWEFPLQVTGFYDRKYPTYFCEDKLSSRPENYLDIFQIQSQNGTYFLADPNLEYCIMEVVQFPQLRESKKKETTPEEMYKRVFDDVLSRPSKYFIGWNKETRRYGKKYYRNEFNLEMVRKRYEQIAVDMMSARWTGNFYPDWKRCSNKFPGIPCEMKAICQTGCISETMYEIKKDNN